jgi:hypothetical protein
MKGKLYISGFVLILSALILSGCCPFPGPFDLIRREVSISGSGVVVGAEWSITGFEKVDVSHAFTVDIRQGDTFRVATSVDENVADYLQVVKQGDTLRIGLKPGTMVTNATLQAEVTMPELTGLDVSGASHVAIAGFKSPKALNVDVSGASSLRGDIEAGDARFDVSGASHVTLSGSGQDANIDASGASEADLAGFAVADAVVEASGASNVTVNASGRLDVDASGASHVYYLGSPALGTIDSSGGSSVESR